MIKKDKKPFSFEEIHSFCTPEREKKEQGAKNSFACSGAKGFFGYSASGSLLPVAALLEIADQELFSSIELSHTQLEACSVMQRNKIVEYFPFIVAGGFVSRDFASNLLDLPPKMLDSFVAELESLFRKFAFLNIKYLSFDLPLYELLQKGDCPERKNLQKLLRKLLPLLTELDQTLLLPLRIPSPCPEKAALLASSFIRESMCTKVKLKWEIHPHELSRQFSVQELAGVSAFDTKCIAFHYNADKGETLVKEHVLPWVEHLCSHGFRGAFLVSPFSADGRFAMTESNAFSQLVKEIRKNPSASALTQSHKEKI